MPALVPRTRTLLTTRRRWKKRVSVRRRASGRVHYNYMREYDSATGRYLESDPLGLESESRSLYTFVSNNPLSRVDPFGLIDWTGTYVSYTAARPIGGFLDIYELVSDCVNCKKASVRVHGKGFAFGVGFPLSGTGGFITLKDLNSDINPNVFNGLYARSGAAWVVGAGVGFGFVQAGGASTQPGFSWVAGVDYSAAWAIGKSRTVSVRWLSCTK